MKNIQSIFAFAAPHVVPYISCTLPCCKEKIGEANLDYMGNIIEILELLLAPHGEKIKLGQLLLLVCGQHSILTRCTGALKSPFSAEFVMYTGGPDDLQAKQPPFVISIIQSDRKC